MEQTFVSNQSREYYSNNNATRFVAQLPGQQRLDDGGWRVGCTKITLPPAVTEMKVSEWTVHLKPHFSLPDTARTSVTLSNMTGQASLVTEFNNKMRALMASWYPLDLNQAGFGGSTTADRTITFAAPASGGSTPAPIDMSGNKTWFDLQNELYKKSILLGTSIVDKKKLRLYVKHSNPVADPLPTWLLRRLGFTSFSAPFGLTSQSGITWRRFEATYRTFHGEAYSSMYGVDCSLRWTLNKKLFLCLGFYDPQNRGQLTLTLPEGMMDLMGVSTAGLEAKTGADGDTYYDIVNKPGYASPPRAENLLTVKLVPDLLNFPLFNLKYLQLTYIEWNRSDVSSYKNSQTGKLEITQRSTAIPQSKLAYVKCSLVPLQQMGQRRLPLLEMMPLSAVATGGSSQPKQYVHVHIKYYPLETTSFQSITFEVEDEDGQRLPFVTNGLTTVSLRFKKI